MHRASVPWLGCRLVRTGPAPNEVAFVSAGGDIEAVQSRDGGAAFGAPAAIGVELPGRIVAGLGADGRGLVVWDENGGDDINAVRISIRSLLRPKR
jgi:hypothetical protein